MDRRVAALQRRIERIKLELGELGELRPGFLSERYNVCGNPSCRCKRDPASRHGPYPLLGWTRKGKSTTRFIRRPQVPAIRAQLSNYARLKKLMDEWVEAST
ncbi:MAG: DUF6788 family protein, partial [Candidatus Methylomirabilales bacterium]